MAEFEQAIASASAETDISQQIQLLKRAVELYQGALLPDCYDEWIEAERDRFHHHMTETLLKLISLLEQTGVAQKAIAYGKRLITLESLSETSYLTVMRLYAQLGDRATALKIYHQCMMVLSEELGVDPSLETRQFYETLLLEDTEPTPPIPVKPAPVIAVSEAEISPSEGAQTDWGEAPDISFFHGRTQEIEQLQTWLNGARCRLIAVLGMGGIGKTSLTAKVLQAVQGEFERIIWRSLRNAPPLQTILGELVPFLSNQQDTACSIPRLMHWLRESRCLIVLDNLETILKEGERAGQFRDTYQNYADLIRVVAQANHQSCFVITSREKPAEISALDGLNNTVQSLQLGGSPEAALALLEASSLQGTQEQKASLGQRYGYSPLALQIVGGSIRDVFDGDISLFLEEDTLLFNGAKKLLDIQFERLIPLEKTVMYWLAINREWTSLSELMSDIYPRCNKSKLLEAIESLRWRSLIERRSNTYTQQPVVMEYVTVCLIEAIGDELLDPECFDADQSYPPLLSSYALIKTTVQDYIRDSQYRLILDPILQELETHLRSPQALISQFQKLIRAIASIDFHRASYAGGNLLNLCCQSQLPVKDLDFSTLTIRQAFLQNSSLHELNLSHASFSQTAFTQAFGVALSLAFSPDGTLLAMGDNNHNVQLWRMGDRQPLMTLRGHHGWVWSIAFSPDGQTLVSGSVDYSVRLWDVSSGACLKTLIGHESVVWSVAFSPDGQTVASGSEDLTAKVWDVQTGACLHTLTVNSGCLRSVIYDQDSQHLVTGHTDQLIRLWDIDSGKCLRIFEGHLGPVWAVSLSPNHQIASAGADQTIRLWDSDSGDCLTVLEGHTDQIWATRFSPDGQFLASGSNDRTVRLWDIQSQSCVATFLGHEDQVWSVAFSPDGKQLASGGFDQAIRLWDLETNQCLQTLNGYTNCIRSLVFEPDSSTLISGGDDTLIRLWDYQKGRCTQTLRGHRSGVWAVAYQADNPDISSSSGGIIATGGFDQSIRLWNRTTGDCIRVLEGNAGWIHSLAFHPTQPLLASGSIAPIVMLWDWTTGECRRVLEGHMDQIWAVAFSPDGQYLASTGADRLVKLWDVETGDCVQTFVGHMDWMYALAFVPVKSAKGKKQRYQLASASGDRTIKLWDIQTGDCLQTFEGHEGWVYSLAAHPTLPLLVSSSHDHTGRIWDIQSGGCLYVLPHGGLLWSMALHPQGHLMACSGEDEQIAVWDVKTGKLYQRFQITKPYMGMRITDVTGLTEEQKSTLKALGAVE